MSDLTASIEWARRIILAAVPEAQSIAVRVDRTRGQGSRRRPFSLDISYTVPCTDLRGLPSWVCVHVARGIGSYAGCHSHWYSSRDEAIGAIEGTVRRWLDAEVLRMTAERTRAAAEAKRQSDIAADLASKADRCQAAIELSREGVK